MVVGISTGFCYFFISTSAFTFPFMIQWRLWNGALGTFLLHAAFSAVGFLFVFFKLKSPDQKSKRYVSISAANTNS